MILLNKTVADKNKVGFSDLKLTPQQKLERLAAMRKGQIDLEPKKIRSSAQVKGVQNDGFRFTPLVGAVVAIPVVSIVGSPLAYLIGLSLSASFALGLSGGIAAGVLYYFTNSN